MRCTALTEVSCVKIWRMNSPGGRNSECKGPEAGMSMVCSRDRKEVSVARRPSWKEARSMGPGGPLEGIRLKVFESPNWQHRCSRVVLLEMSIVTMAV